MSKIVVVSKITKENKVKQKISVIASIRDKSCQVLLTNIRFL